MSNFLFYYNLDSRFGSNSDQICVVDIIKFRNSFYLMRRKKYHCFFSENAILVDL